MKLIDNPLSPYSLKIRMILYEKGIPFEKSSRAAARSCRRGDGYEETRKNRSISRNTSCVGATTCGRSRRHLVRTN